ncbi:MAG: adenylate kinase [Dysgonamonadaceae bacterium]|jgi:adenylate kinase|nr:adenylate kinase [Dysgonamonadaceae bacterium]
MFNIVILGAPGSGKGTQSELIVNKYGFYHISTGDILRKEIENQTALGLKAKRYINQGQLIPDQMIISVLAEILDKQLQSKGYIFDGFPRTLAQGEALDAMLREKETTIAAAIYLKVGEEELMQRLIKRGEFSGRSDDTQKIIQNRLNVYKEQTEPLKEYYRKKGKLFTIEGKNTIEDIFESVAEVINRLAFK